MGLRQPDIAAADARPGRFESIARLTRLLAAGVSTGFAGVGLATAAGTPGPAVVAAVLAAGLAFHVFAFLGNDVMDLPIDRTDPRRASSPLVRGDTAAPSALAIALAALPIGLGVLVLAGAEAAVAPMVVAAIGLAGYNLAGKAIPVPFVADLEQGAAFAFLVGAGAAAGGGATVLTWWAAAFAVVLIALTNGIHGAVRDAENDAAAGARTTAVLLGARTTTRGGIELPAGLVLWAVLLQAALGVLLAAPVLTGALRLTGPRLAAAGGAALACYLPVVWTFAMAYARRHRLHEALSWGSWNLLWSLAAFLTLYLPRLPAWAAVAVTGCYLGPVLLYDRAVRSTASALPATERGPGQSALAVPRAARARALWRMTRPGNWQVAAALTAVGGAVTGGPWTRFALAAAVAACVVMAANVFNDRCDLAADRVNRPDRPIPSGVVSGNDADRFVLGASAAAIGFAAPLGASAPVIAGGALVLALGYSLVLRRAGILGPLTVAGLFAAPIPIGGLFVAGAVEAVHAFGAAIVITLVFAREALKAVPDIAGDSAAGYSTVGTRFGRVGALRLFRLGCVAFFGALLAPVLAGAAGPAYLAASVACAATPTLLALWTVRADPREEAIASALQSTSLVFGLGLLPLALLVAS